MVPTKRKLGCRYGSQDIKAEDSMATRTCVGNLMWGIYDGSTCATLDTQILRNISNVSVWSYHRGYWNNVMLGACLFRHQ